VTHTQQLQIVEVAVTGYDLRQHVSARVLPALLDHRGKVIEQLVPLVEVGLGEIPVADDGVFPADQKVTILQGQTIKVEERLERVQACEIRHHLALASGGKGSDHVGGVALQNRPGLTQRVRAEERLQNLAVTSVLRRVERQRQHWQGITRGLERQS